MSILELSQTRSKYARACVPLKSDNKIYGQSAPVPLHRQADNTPEKKAARVAAVTEIKKSMPMPNCNISNVHRLRTRIMKAKAGNCRPATAPRTSVYLTWQFKTQPATLDLVILIQADVKLFRPDHIFLVLDRPRPVVGKLYPRSC